jgi:hypothetical protein
MLISPGWRVYCSQVGVICSCRWGQSNLYSPLPFAHVTSQFSFGALLDRPDFIFRIIESTDAVGIEVQGDAFFTQGGDPAGELDDLGVAKIPFCFGRMRYTVANGTK